MESYVEVAFLHNWMTNFISVWMALYLIQRPLRGKRVLLYSLVTSFYSSLFYFDDAWLGVIILEGIAFCYVFYRQKSLFCASLLFRFLWHATCFVFFEGTFHLGSFFPWIHTPIYWCWVIYAIMFFYLSTHAMTLFKQKFCYRCTLYGKKMIHLTGYMDSGNLLCYQGIPVLFLDEGFRDELQGKIVKIQVGSIHDKKEMEAVLVYCSLDGGSKRKAYVICVRGLRIQGGHPLLLNLKLLTMR